MAEDIDQDETFDEEDLADGFDAEDLDASDIDVDDIVVAELEDDDVLAIDVDDADADDEVAIVDDDAEDVVVEAEAVVADEEDDLNLEHDVELALDEVLAETMRLTTDVDEDEDVAPEPEDKGELGESVLPKQDDEFRCASCRLLKKTSQLASKDKMLCRDCV